MKLIKPSYEILEQKPSLEGIYEAIELAGRICYKSTRKEGTTAKGFVDRMIASQHYAMLEHGTVYLRQDISLKDMAIAMSNGEKPVMELLEKYGENPYSNAGGGRLFDEDIFTIVVTTNYRVLVENDWLNDLQYLCEPTEYHEKRVTVMFTTSNSIMREATRHRVFSFAVESTRYCNYSKDRFGNELMFVAPSWMSDFDISNVPYYLTGEEFRMNIKSLHLINALSQCESCYLSMIKDGAKPQEAREVLPLATKCNMVMTGFVSDWIHFFKLRTSIIAETGMPHPDMAALADPLYKEFIKLGYIKEIK